MQKDYVLVLANHLDQLALIETWLKDVAVGVGLNSDDVFNLQLLLNEAVTNVIQHAYTDENEHRITITASSTYRVLSVIIDDDGIPFDPSAYPEPVLTANLQEAVIGGLGIKLIRSHTTTMTYRRVGEQNQLTLTLDRSQPPR